MPNAAIDKAPLPGSPGPAVKPEPSGSREDATPPGSAVAQATPPQSVASPGSQQAGQATAGQPAAVERLPRMVGRGLPHDRNAYAVVDLTADRAPEVTPVFLRGGRSASPVQADQATAPAASVSSIDERVLEEHLALAMEAAVRRILPAALEAARLAARKAPPGAPPQLPVDSGTPSA